MAKKKNKKIKKSKRVSKKSVSKKTDKNILIYAAVAALALIVVVFAMPSGNKNKPQVKETSF